MARRKTTATASGDRPNATASVDDDVATGAATGTSSGASAGVADAGAGASIMQQMAGMMEQMKSITDAVSKTTLQKTDVGEDEAQGAGIVQGTDSHRSLSVLVGNDANTRSNHSHGETARFASHLQALTTVAVGAMQTLMVAVTATAAQTEAAQRGANADIIGGHRHRAKPE